MSVNNDPFFSHSLLGTTFSFTNAQVLQTDTPRFPLQEKSGSFYSYPHPRIADKMSGYHKNYQEMIESLESLSCINPYAHERGIRLFFSLFSDILKYAKEKLPEVSYLCITHADCSSDTLFEKYVYEGVTSAILESLESLQVIFPTSLLNQIINPLLHKKQEALALILLLKAAKTGLLLIPAENTGEHFTPELKEKIGQCEKELLQKGTISSDDLLNDLKEQLEIRENRNCLHEMLQKIGECKEAENIPETILHWLKKPDPIEGLALPPVEWREFLEFLTFLEDFSHIEELSLTSFLEKIINPLLYKKQETFALIILLKAIKTGLFLTPADNTVENFTSELKEKIDQCEKEILERGTITSDYLLNALKEEIVKKENKTDLYKMLHKIGECNEAKNTAETFINWLRKLSYKTPLDICSKLLDKAREKNDQNILTEIRWHKLSYIVNIKYTYKVSQEDFSQLFHFLLNLFKFAIEQNNFEALPKITEFLYTHRKNLISSPYLSENELFFKEVLNLAIETPKDEYKGFLIPLLLEICYIFQTNPSSSLLSQFPFINPDWLVELYTNLNRTKIPSKLMDDIRIIVVNSMMKKEDDSLSVTTWRRLSKSIKPLLLGNLTIKDKSILFEKYIAWTQISNSPESFRRQKISQINGFLYKLLQPENHDPSFLFGLMTNLQHNEILGTFKDKEKIILRKIFSCSECPIDISKKAIAFFVENREIYKNEEDYPDLWNAFFIFIQKFTEPGSFKDFDSSIICSLLDLLEKEHLNPEQTDLILSQFPEAIKNESALKKIIHFYLTDRTKETSALSSNSLKKILSYIAKIPEKILSESIVQPINFTQEDREISDPDMHKLIIQIYLKINVGTSNIKQEFLSFALKERIRANEPKRDLPLDFRVIEKCMLSKEFQRKCLDLITNIASQNMSKGDSGKITNFVTKIVRIITMQPITKEDGETVINIVTSLRKIYPAIPEDLPVLLAKKVYSPQFIKFLRLEMDKLCNDNTVRNDKKQQIENDLAQILQSSDPKFLIKYTKLLNHKYCTKHIPKNRLLILKQKYLDRLQEMLSAGNVQFEVLSKLTSTAIEHEDSCDHLTPSQKIKFYTIAVNTIPEISSNASHVGRKVNTLLTILKKLSVLQLKFKGNIEFKNLSQKICSLIFNRLTEETKIGHLKDIDWFSSFINLEKKDRHIIEFYRYLFSQLGNVEINKKLANLHAQLLSVFDEKTLDLLCQHKVADIAFAGASLTIFPDQTKCFDLLHPLVSLLQKKELDQILIKVADICFKKAFAFGKNENIYTYLENLVPQVQVILEATYKKTCRAKAGKSFMRIQFFTQRALTGLDCSIDIKVEMNLIQDIVYKLLEKKTLQATNYALSFFETVGDLPEMYKHREICDKPDKIFKQIITEVKKYPLAPEESSTSFHCTIATLYLSIQTSLGMNCESEYCDADFMKYSEKKLSDLDEISYQRPIQFKMYFVYKTFIQKLNDKNDFQYYKFIRKTIEQFYSSADLKDSNEFLKLQYQLIQYLTQIGKLDHVTLKYLKKHTQNISMSTASNKTVMLEKAFINLFKNLDKKTQLTLYALVPRYLETKENSHTL